MRDVLNRSQGEGTFDAGNRWNYRRRARAQDEFVVGKFIRSSGSQIPNAEHFLICINLRHFALDANIQAESLVERLRRLQEKVLFIFDYAADVVGETAVRVTHVAASFDNDYFHRRVQAAKSRCG